MQTTFPQNFSPAEGTLVPSPGKTAEKKAQMPNPGV